MSAKEFERAVAGISNRVLANRESRFENPCGCKKCAGGEHRTLGVNRRRASPKSKLSMAASSKTLPQLIKWTPPLNPWRDGQQPQRDSPMQAARLQKLPSFYLDMIPRLQKPGPSQSFEGVDTRPRGLCLKSLPKALAASLALTILSSSVKESNFLDISSYLLLLFETISHMLIVRPG